MDSQTDWLEKLYSTTVDLFCRDKNDNNMNITYINACNDALKAW